jgi:NAD-dependent SIR2 family protein deacetylase
MTSLVVASSVACNTCKHRLAFEYVRYRDTKGKPYCRECYIQIGGVA